MSGRSRQQSTYNSYSIRSTALRRSPWNSKRSAEVRCRRSAGGRRSGIRTRSSDGRHEMRRHPRLETGPRMPGQVLGRQEMRNLATRPSGCARGLTSRDRGHVPPAARRPHLARSGRRRKSGTAPSAIRSKGARFIPNSNIGSATREVSASEPRPRSGPHVAVTVGEVGKKCAPCRSERRSCQRLTSGNPSNVPFATTRRQRLRRTSAGLRSAAYAHSSASRRVAFSGSTHTLPTRPSRRGVSPGLAARCRSIRSAVDFPGAEVALVIHTGRQDMRTSARAIVGAGPPAKYAFLADRPDQANIRRLSTSAIAADDRGSHVRTAPRPRDQTRI